MTQKRDVNAETIESLRQLTEDLERGDVSGSRVTKLVRDEDGNIRRIVYQGDKQA